MKKYNKEIEQIKTSLSKQQENFIETLILNPVENVPSPKILQPAAGFLHGLYNTDTIRNEDEKFKSKLQFSNRNQITKDIDTIYKMWADALGAEKLSMRLLSGLHAHIIVFMGICDIGDKVLILPEKAGGHMSSWAILERLGLQLREIPYNKSMCCVDKEACINAIDEFKPDVIFVDRSEGLIYEDFTWLGHCCNCYKVFDASQYLTNILAGDYKNPFDMGFDLIISTLHKNLPGPQRALICTNKVSETWNKLKKKISTYVSNMHVFSIYSAGLLLEELDELFQLSHNMLLNATMLEQSLNAASVPIINRICSKDAPPTHHCWIHPPTQEKAFSFFLDLERVGILTNYRLLPYDIGYGLRLGLSGATKSGLRPNHIEQLSQILCEIYHKGYSKIIHDETRDFICKIKEEK